VVAIKGMRSFKSSATARLGLPRLATTLACPRPLTGSVSWQSQPSGTEFTGRQNSNDSAALQGFKMEQNQDSNSTTRMLPPHYYGYGSDLSLEQEKFIVGFAGADYGFLYDLGETPLDRISLETPEVKFLVSYEPPFKMTEVRAEQAKLFNTPAYEANGFAYKHSLPALTGHTYILRSLNFSKSDVLVALRVYRQDADGSLIVFWKKLKTFAIPELAQKVD